MNRRSAATNYIINVSGLTLPIFVTVVTLPLYIRAIGEARYGVLALVWLMLGYSGFLDFGLSRATENALAKASVHADRERLLATALVLNLGSGLCGAIVLYFGMGYALTHFLSTPSTLQNEVRAVAPYIAVLVPMALMAGVMGGALSSRERFFTSNLINVVGAIVGQIVPVICAIAISPSLSVIVPAAVMTRAAGLFASLIVVYRQERPLRLSAFDFPTAKKLLGYGGWVSLSSIIGPILVSVDQLIIGARFGVQSVTYYAVPMSLVSRGQVFAAAMLRTLFPRLSRLDLAEARRMAEDATIALAFSFAALCGPAVIVVHSVLYAWMGPQFAVRSAPVAELLLIGAWINGVAFVPFGFLQAQGRPDIAAKFHIAELLPFIAVLWLASTYFGLVGAAMAWTLRVTADAILMIAAARYQRRTASLLLIPAGFMLTCLALANVHPSFLTAWILAFLFGLGVTLVGVILDATLRNQFNRVWNQLRGKIGRLRTSN